MPVSPRQLVLGCCAGRRAGRQCLTCSSVPLTAFMLPPSSWPGMLVRAIPLLPDLVGLDWLVLLKEVVSIHLKDWRTLDLHLEYPFSK
jgi:hypothetical protein